MLFRSIMNNESRELTNNDIKTLNEIREMFQQWIRDEWHGHATISIKRYFLPILKEEFPNFEFVPAFPSLEEGPPMEKLSDKEKELLRTYLGRLPEFAKDIWPDKDKITLSVYY